MSGTPTTGDYAWGEVMTFKMAKADVELPTFFKNSYDADGEIYEQGYWLCFGDTSIKIASDDDGLARFIDHINNMEQEMHDCPG